jgi:hypothetical protein
MAKKNRLTLVAKREIRLLPLTAIRMPESVRAFMERINRSVPSK